MQGNPAPGRQRVDPVVTPVRARLRVQSLSSAPELATNEAVELLTSERELASVRHDWSRLATSSGNLFGTPEWILTWWRHFGAGRRLSTLACRSRTGRLVAVVPLYEYVRRPVRVMRFAGHGAGDVLGPVCLPRARASVAQAIQEIVKQRRWGLDLLLAERLPAADGWDQLLPGRLLHHEGSPALRLENMSWDDFLSTRSGNFRRRLRQYERRLARQPGFRVRLADNPNQVADDMAVLLRLHDARWAKTKSHAFDRRRRALHLEWAAIALSRGWLRLWVMEIAGRPVAAWYGFRFGGAEWFYQAGRDPAWNRDSVGFVLICHSIREAIADGVAEYKLLRGEEPYKARFATHVERLDTIALGDPFTERVALAGAGLSRALSGSLRQRLYWAIG